MRDPDSKPCGCFLWVECTCAEEAVSEIASLRAENERLMADLLKSNERGAVVSVRARAAEDALSASRALADRLAAAMRLVLSWTPEDPHGGLASDMAFARAALRAWEEARRGSEGGGR